MEYFSFSRSALALAHASVFQKNEKKNKTTSVRVQATLQKLHRNHRCYVFTEAISGVVSLPAPKLSGVVWTPIRITPKIVTILMCEYPGCQRLIMRGFRFRSVLKSDPREKLRRSCLRPSACGRQYEAPRRTRETTSGIQGNVWMEAPFRQMKSEK